MAKVLENIVKKCFERFLRGLSGTQKAIEDVAVSMIPQGISVVTGFLASVLIARGLGPKGMGSYALILSVSGIAAALSDLGIGQTAIRYASQAVKNGDSISQFSTLRWAFRLRMMLVSLISIAAFVFAPYLADQIWHESELTSLVRMSLLAGIFAAIAAIPTIYFQSLKRFRMNAAIGAGQALVSFLGIVVVAVLNNWSLDKVILVSVITTGLVAFAFAVVVPKEAFIAPIGQRQLHVSLFKNFFSAPKSGAGQPNSLDSTGVNTFAFFMLISSVAVTLTMRVDVWLMGYYLDKSQIGIYSIATRFTLPLVIVLGSLNTALWPRASALSSLVQAREMIIKTFSLSLLVAVAGILYSVFVPFMMPYIFGSKYSGGVLLAQLLSVRYCLSILTCPIGVIGYSLGLVKVYWWINILQLLVVVIINVLLLPKIGVAASAIALIANEIIGFILAATIIWLRIKSKVANFGVPN